MGGLLGEPFAPGPPKTTALKAALIPQLLFAATSQSLVHPTLEGLFLGDGHLPLDLEHLAGTELGMERADQVKALEEHLNSTVVNGDLMLIQQCPIQLGGLK